MATVWELITEASSLPDDGVNTFWDHLNNLEGTGTGGDPYPVFYQDIQVEVATRDIQVMVPETAIETDQPEILTSVEEIDVQTNIPIIKVEVDE